MILHRVIFERLVCLALAISFVAYPLFVLAQNDDRVLSVIRDVQSELGSARVSESSKLQALLPKESQRIKVSKTLEAIPLRPKATVDVSKSFQEGAGKPASINTRKPSERFLASERGLSLGYPVVLMEGELLHAVSRKPLLRSALTALQRRDSSDKVRLKETLELRFPFFEESTFSLLSYILASQEEKSADRPLGSVWEQTSVASTVRNVPFDVRYQRLRGVYSDASSLFSVSAAPESYRISQGRNVSSLMSFDMRSSIAFEQREKASECSVAVINEGSLIGSNVAFGPDEQFLARRFTLYPRELYAIELTANNPLSDWDRSIVYFDKLTSRVAYRFDFDEEEKLVREVAYSWIPAARADGSEEWFPSAFIIFDSDAGFESFSVKRIHACAQLPTVLEASFDPNKLAKSRAALRDFLEDGDPEKES